MDAAARIDGSTVGRCRDHESCGRHPRALLLLALGVAEVVGGCALQQPRDDDDLRARESAVTNGEASERSGVVALLGDAGLCSGTLIAEQVVLTAAHCVYLGAPERVSFAFALPVDTSPSSAIARVVTPETYDRITRDDDLALVFLAEPAPAEVTRWSLGGAPPAAGQLVELIGYGDDGAGGVGVQRRGLAEVRKLDAQRITVVPAPSSTCGGDSGGPMGLPREPGVVVGIASSALTTCDGEARHTRVDTHRGSFLDPLIASFSASDLDVGAWCVADGQCASGQCALSAEMDFFSYCTDGCQADSQCPAEMSCADGLCRFSGYPPGALGAGCDSVNDCVSRRCESSGGEARCARLCIDDPDSSLACPEGFACGDAEGSLQSFCFPVRDAGCTIAPGQGRRGGAVLWLAVLAALAALAAPRGRTRQARQPGA